MSSVATEQRRVTHTYTSPEGAVVVVTNVPATVVPREEAEDAVHYDMDTALLLDEKIRGALLRDRTPGVVHNVAWDSQSTRPPVDLEVRVQGASVRYGEASVDVWQHVLQRIHTAYSTVLGHLHPGARSPLQLVFAGDGSLLFGLRARHSTPLFDAPDLPQEAALRALRIIVEASQWLDEDELPEDAKADPRLADVALRALEELSPTPRGGVDTITLLPDPESLPDAPTSRLTKASSKRATHHRVALASAFQDARRIDLVGMIDKVSIDSKFHMRDIESAPDFWTSEIANVRYTPDMLADIVEAFRDQHNVRVVATQTRKSGRWLKTLDAKSIEIVGYDED